jgi:hypothetical protein
MPNLSTHHSSSIVKALYLGDSGTGKTGSLASLVEAGYNLRVLDFDNGLDILASMLPADKLSSVIYETCTDKFKTVGGKVIVDGVPKAFSKAMNLLTNWKTDDQDLGSVSTWTSNDVLVIDSLTHCGKAAMRQALALGNRLNQHPHQSDWGVAQGMLEDMISLLCSEAVPCNVLILAHWDNFGDTDEKGQPVGPQRGLPISLGKALSPRIPTYFNSTILAKRIGIGAGARRRIYTVPQDSIELKSSAPKSVKAEYELPTGLAEFFRDARKHGGGK